MLSFLHRLMASTGEFAAAPAMGAEQQTRLSWARVIESPDDIPGHFRTQLAALTGDVYHDAATGGRTSSPAFPYCVLTPSFEGFLHRTNPRLVCWQEGQILVLERVRNEVAVTSLPPGTVHCVETGHVLLRAWLRLRGCAAGSLINARLEFNTVTDRLFAPIIEGLRHAGAVTASADLPVTAASGEGARFAYLREQNFKLMNYGRNCLLPGEHVACTLYQPAIRRTTLTALGRTWTRPLAAAHLTILTDHELIIVRDDGTSVNAAGRWMSRSWRDADARYGGAWTFMPLGKILGLNIEGRPGGLLALGIQLPGGDRVESLFEANQRDGVVALKEMIEKRALAA